MKERYVKFIWDCLFIIVMVVIVFYLGFIMGIKKQSDFDIDHQHLSLMQSHTYKYCPYCGEYIGEEE